MSSIEVGTKEPEKKRRKLDNNMHEKMKTNWGRPAPNESEKRMGEEIREPSKKRSKPSNKQDEGVGGGAPEMGEAPTLNKKSPGDIIGDSDEYSKEIQEISKKYEGDERFHDMKKINEKREEDKRAEEAKVNERKEKVKGLEATWALARLCKRIIKESESDWDDRREEIRKNLEEFDENVKRKERLDKVEKKKVVIKKRQSQSRIDIMLFEQQGC